MSEGVNQINENLLKQYEQSFVEEILSNIKGISKKNAIMLSGIIDTLEEFFNITESELKNLKSRSNRRMITDNAIEEINKKREEVKVLLKLLEVEDEKQVDIRALWMLYLTKLFIDKQLDNLQNKTLSSLDINPHLSLVLNFNKDDIINFFVMQTISRSIVTSWGMFVENFLKYSGCEVNTKEILDILVDAETKKKIKGSNTDLIKVIRDTIYFIQVKSGPNTMNVEMVGGLNRALEAIDKIEVQNLGDEIPILGATVGDIQNVRSILGMTYGKKDRISVQIKDNLVGFTDKAKVGRELWDFVAQESDYFKHVLTLMKIASVEFIGCNFMDKIKEQIEVIRKEWDEKFKDTPVEEVLRENYL